MREFTRNNAVLNYTNLSERFYIREKNYTRQYAPLYAERLAAMREAVKKSASLKWPKYPAKNLVDIDKEEKCVIIGTLYKEMALKPSILKELFDEAESIIQPIKERFTSPTDYLILEDELQRIMLIGNISVSKMCTGVIVAVLGFENEASKFEVEDYCFKQIEHAEKIPFPLKCQDRYLVFVSGMELGATATHLMKIQMFIDFLSGDFLADDEDESVCNVICNTERLIIAGNSLDSTTQSKEMHNKAKYLTKNYIAGSVHSIKQLDDYVHQIANKGIDIDIMPGEYDPSNYMMPQQPLHPAMFTKSKSFKSFHSATNPYEFKLDAVKFVGTSGQPVNDIKRFTDIDDSIEAMELTLKTAHLAPTCPDTLAAYPYYGKDPFILNELPHVYFCGNQSEYKHKVVNINECEVHLIAIPKFKESFSCVFVNVRTLQSDEFTF